MSLLRFIEGLPKVELHVHIEGTLEPELMFALAARNNVALPYASVEAVRAAYAFGSLDAFLALYYQGMAVLRTEQDYCDLASTYLARVAAQNVVHAEIFFDPQGHTTRGVPFATVIGGLTRGLAEGGGRFGVSTRLIMCFLRDLSEADAMATLAEALPYKDRIVGVGLDSAERGNPPSKFARVFAQARAEGFKLVAHAGEEGPPDYVWQALDVLGIDRLDHGNRALEDPALVQRLARDRMALTVCPLSNLKLGGIAAMRDHPLKRMLDLGLRATVNSDDPAYFGGYMTENCAAVADALGLERADLAGLARHAIDASLLPPPDAAALHARLAAYLATA